MRLKDLRVTYLVKLNKILTPITGIENPKEVAKVGDTTYDLIEGNAAGCKFVIGVTTGAFTEETLKTVKHSHLIKELPEILNILKVPHKLVTNFNLKI